MPALAIADRRAAVGLLITGLAVLANLALWSVLLVAHSRPGGVAVDPADVVYGEPVRSTYAAAAPQSAPLEVVTATRARIRVPEPYRNLGTVRRGERVEVTFAVQNAGEEALVVRGLESTSALLSAELSAAVIPPGRTALLTVALDATRFQGQDGARLRRGVIIHSSDAQQPHAEVWVQAAIQP